MPIPPPLSILSCAKVNLSLDIVGLRPDGYHELRSIVHTLALCDTLRLTFDDSRNWRLRCDDPALQTPDNLCLRAARAWSQAAQSRGLEDIGGEISLLKRIPYGAGLGGGSGNAWAVLEALSHAFDREHKMVPQADLEEMAKRLGADVPLFARGGALLIEGIGERITELSALSAWVVLAQPREIISTPAAFQVWDNADVPSGQHTPRLLRAWNDSAATDEERLELIGARLGNDLSVAARALGVPVGAGIEALLEAGALGAEMTGSGSAVFGLCRDEEHARQVFQSANAVLSDQREEHGWRLWSAPLCSYGTRLEASL